MGEYAIGQSVPRTEDPRLLRGGGRYVDDVILPRMAYGYVLRSPHAHAAIRRLDAAAARAAPGVLAVVTGADWSAAGLGPMPSQRNRTRRGGAPMFVPPFPVLATDRVRRVGDYMVFIVAETLDQAKDAAELVEIDYEILPAIVDTAAAVAAGAAAVWDDCPDNVCFVHEAGDKAAADAAFARADRVVKARFVINRVTASTMEPRGCVADYHPADETFTLHVAAQNMFPTRAEIASRFLGVPETDIRMIIGDVGGSFGMKGALSHELVLSAYVSREIGRPVKWTSDRAEAFLSDPAGRDNVTEAELALDEEGRFLGQRMRTLAAMGSYVSAMGANPPVMNLGTAAGVYTTGAIHIDVTGVFTNTNPTQPYRGAGRPEAAYVIERLIDLAADELGIDPAELRRRNTIPEDGFPYKTALTFTYDCGAFEKTMDLALDMAGYRGFEERRAAARWRGRLRGIGLSNTIERAAAAGVEGAEIRFGRGGTATLLAGSNTQGQGHETVFKQIVCDRLGLELADVRYVWGDTEKVPFGQGTGGSRSATIGGSAVKIAADRIVEKARRIAAHMLEASADDIAFDDGVFTIAGTDRSLTMKEVAVAAANPPNLPPDMEPGLVASAVYTATEQNFPNGCHVCEIEIDPETGTHEIVAYNVVDDVGTVLNPLLLKGQIQGGIAQGAGQILMEDIAYDPDSGQLLTGSFMDYAMPRADDFTYFEVASNPVPTATNPLGVKGGGESGTVGAMPAVANAIVDALSPLGIRDIPMPATPERLWRLIKGAEAGG